jgi:hypothetical protein
MRRVIAVILSFAATGAYWQVGAQTNTSGTDGFQFVDKTGNIRKPTNVRDTYQSRGAFTVLDPRETKCTSPTRLPAQRKRIAAPANLAMELSW